MIVRMVEIRPERTIPVATLMGQSRARWPESLVDEGEAEIHPGVLVA
jgi:hypothetical protein